MPDDPRFDFEVKVRRALDHLKEIEDLSGRWFRSQQGPDSLLFRHHPEREGYYIVLATAEPPPAYPLSAVIGDCIHNLRASLDFLAYELAANHTRPLPRNIALSSEFPIFWDEGKYLARAEAKIRGLHPDAQTVVQTLQPYVLGNDYFEHPLFVLHQLDIANKHRLLHTVVGRSHGLLMDTHALNGAFQRQQEVHPENAALINGEVGDFYDTIHAPVISNQTPVAQIAEWLVPAAKASAALFRPALEIAFEPQPKWGGPHTVLHALHIITEYITRGVWPSLNRFLP